jgi:hypothetical protein
MFNIKETPWCSPCEAPHLEYECPQRDEDSFDSIKFMDMICNFREEDITQEKNDEVRKRGAREG